MNGKISQNILVFVSLFLAIYVGYFLVSSDGRGISSLMRILAVVLSIMGLFRPKLGMVMLVLLILSNDLIKRLGIYYGVTNMMIVIEVMAVPPVVACFTFLGAYLSGFRDANQKLSKGDKYRTLIAIVMALIFSGTIAMSGSLLGTLRSSATGSVYMFLIPVVPMLYKRKEDVMGFIVFIVFCTLPVALYGIKQSLFGFAEFEIYYNESGLGADKTTGAMARAFSSLGSVHGYSAISIIVPIGFWLSFNYHKFRKRLFIISVIIAFAQVASLSRSGTVIMLGALFIYFMFYTRTRIFLIYSFLIGSYLTIFFSADFLIQKIGVAQAETVMLEDEKLRFMTNLGSYTDRLIGFSNMQDKRMWSWFGLDKEIWLEEYDVNSPYHTHDAIGAILKRIGAVGLLMTLFILGIGAYQIHKICLRCRFVNNKKAIVMLTAITVSNFAGMAMAQGNIHVNPWNLFTWTFVGAIFVISRADSLEAKQQQLV